MKPIILNIFLILLAAFCCPVFGKASVLPTLTVPVLYDDAVPKDLPLINEALNEITQKEIGVEISLVGLIYNQESSSLDNLELELLKKQGVEFDLLPTILKRALPDASYLPLDALLSSYGQGILSSLDEHTRSFLEIEDTITTLPSASDYVSSFGLSMRKDLVEKYGIDLDSITSLDDVDHLFHFLHQKEPKLYMVYGYRGTSFIKRLKAAEIHVAPIATLLPDGHFENYYATEEYSHMISLFYSWDQAGYLPTAMALQNMTASKLVEAGVLFSYFSPYKPSIEAEETINSSFDMVTIPLMESIVTVSSLETPVHWGINALCPYPEKAMEFLNLMYCNEEVVNLLIYGIEGVHYEVLPNGLIDYPEGTTCETVTYQNSQPWFLPNQLISHIFTGNEPSLWEDTQTFNLTAPVSETLYFPFDDSRVTVQIQEIESILSKYTEGLETGQLDPDYYLPEMLSLLTEAGVNEVLAEIQKQYDQWLEEADS